MARPGRCVIVPCPAQLRQQSVAKTRRRLRRRTSYFVRRTGRAHRYGPDCTATYLI